MEQTISPATVTQQIPATVVPLDANKGSLNNSIKLSNITIPRKLSIGAVDDPLEDKANATANKVRRVPEQSFIKRKCAHCEEEEKAQRKPLASFIQKKQSSTNNSVVANDNIYNKMQSTKGGGNAMHETTKRFMESRFDTDFSNVKIHTGGYASQLSKELSAQAFTVGNDIYFNEGKYQPESEQGKHLLAHELTHTLQQSTNNTIQKKVLPSKVSCNSYPRTYPIFKWMNTDDPTNMIQETDDAAILLLTNTIDELQSISNAVSSGAVAAVPTFSDCTAESIQTRLRINPQNAASWTGHGAGTISHFISWLINLRRTFQSGSVRYNCRGSLCESTYGAYIVPGEGFLINLCVHFWSGPNANVRAIQLIHEFAHVYYDTLDSGRGAGSSYCIHGIIADLNNLHTEMAGYENWGGGNMVSC